MKLIVNVLFLVFFLFSCNSTVKQDSGYVRLAKKDTVFGSGGVVNGKITCPEKVNDVIVTLKNGVSPEALEGEPTMTIKGVMDFIEKNNITTITELLNSLPIYFRTNFSLVEVTKGEGQSSLKFPRIVLFGSDGRFLMNISTKADDPKYDLLDCAALDDTTGIWEFSQFDFTKEKPVLHTSPVSCVRCHGDDPRPVWGTNMDWPGVFGDNEAAGPNGEAISYRHVLRMREIREGKGKSDRFDFLKWSNEPLISGGIRNIADNAFGAELLVSNLVMGSATGRGVFLRMKNKFPDNYKELREVLLLLGYEKMVSGLLSDQDKYKIKKVIAKFGGEGGSIDDLFKVLGIDTSEAFSLATIAKEEKPRTNWSLGAGDLYEQVLLQVLDDLSNEKSEVADILRSIPNTVGIFGCENLGDTMQDMVDFKMLHLYKLQGRARYEVNKVYYPQDVEDIKGKLFVPIYDKLGPYLRKQLSKV